MLSNIPYKRAIISSIAGLSALLLILTILIPGARLLIAFFVYTATLNSGLIPFPTMTAAIFLGKSHSPFLVAATGTLGSVVSSVIVYYLLTELSRKKRMRRIENSRIVGGWRKLTRKAPFLSLVVFNVLPLPIEPSRFAAILNRYSIVRYVMAISLGRFARYFILAALGEAFRIPNSVLIVLTIVLVAVPFLLRRFRRKPERRMVIA